MDTVILDQRHLTAREILPGSFAIEKAWRDQAEKLGFRHREEIVHELREDDRELTAYVNNGRWVADCLNCAAGVAAGPDFPRGCCLACGSIFRLKHPPAGDVQAATEILAVRPPDNRNWHPWRETVDDLANENQAHGFVTDEERARGEIEELAVRSGLAVSTVEKILRAQKDLGR